MATTRKRPNEIQNIRDEEDNWHTDQEGITHKTTNEFKKSDSNMIIQ